MRICLCLFILIILRISAQNTPTIVFGRTESRAGNGIAYSVEAAKGYGVRNLSSSVDKIVSVLKIYIKNIT